MPCDRPADILLLLSAPHTHLNLHSATSQISPRLLRAAVFWRTAKLAAGDLPTAQSDRACALQLDIHMHICMNGDRHLWQGKWCCCTCSDVNRRPTVSYNRRDQGRAGAPCVSQTGTLWYGWLCRRGSSQVTSTTAGSPGGSKSPRAGQPPRNLPGTQNVTDSDSFAHMPHTFLH